MTQPEKVDLLLKGGTLVTMDAGRRIIENGALAVRDNKIFALGSAKEVLPKVEAQKTLDVSGQVVTPGFINTHGHWAMTLFRGMVDDARWKPGWTASGRWSWHLPRRRMSLPAHNWQ